MANIKYNEINNMAEFVRNPFVNTYSNQFVPWPNYQFSECPQNHWQQRQAAATAATIRSGENFECRHKCFKPINPIVFSIEPTIKQPHKFITDFFTQQTDIIVEKPALKTQPRPLIQKFIPITKNHLHEDDKKRPFVVDIETYFKKHQDLFSKKHTVNPDKETTTMDLTINMEKETTTMDLMTNMDKETTTMDLTDYVDDLLSDYVEDDNRNNDNNEQTDEQKTDKNSEDIDLTVNDLLDATDSMDTDDTQMNDIDEIEIAEALAEQQLQQQE